MNQYSTVTCRPTGLIGFISSTSRPRISGPVARTVVSSHHLRETERKLGVVTTEAGFPDEPRKENHVLKGKDEERARGEPRAGVQLIGTA